MTQKKQDESFGRFLSLVLRHQPELVGITLDEHGWADVDALLAGCKRAGKQIDREMLERIVRENSKQRYAFNADHSQIRARQGHSIAVDLDFTEQKPPARLYHGTATRFLDKIQTNGIQKMSRQYVHLSETRETAQRVGARHGTPVILPIDTTKMLAAGYRFYRSENGVWLCEAVPWNYVIVSEMKSDLG